MSSRQPRDEIPGHVRAAITRLEARIRLQREMLWQPRLELVLARDIARSRRLIEALRRQRD